MGLVNGTTNTIEDVVWKEGANIKKDLPQALLVAVNQYNRPALFTGSNGKGVVPIFFILCEWSSIFKSRQIY